MGDRDAEKKVFEAFLQARPRFAGAKVTTWCQPKDDPPDVRCELTRGRVVGVELTEWLHQDQMRRGKQRERLEESIQEALDPVPPNNTANIRSVSMTPRPGAPRFDANNASKFKAELLQVVAKIDQSLTDAAPFGQRSVSPWRDFRDHPTLGKYVSQVDFQSRNQLSGRPGRKSVDCDGAAGRLVHP